MNYRHLALARELNLVSDTDIEKWAYRQLESSQNPEWWFSYLVSASALDSTLSIIVEAAEDEERKDSYNHCTQYGDFESWFLFLGLVIRRLKFDYVYSEIFEIAENDGSVEALLILRSLDEVYRCFDGSVHIVGNRWSDLFSTRQLIFFENSIVRFFKCFDIDPRKWLESEVAKG
ncbi:hypothetical protein [Microbulbifer agarilyticus]